MRTQKIAFWDYNLALHKIFRQHKHRKNVSLYAITHTFSYDIFTIYFHSVAQKKIELSLFMNAQKMSVDQKNSYTF